MKDYQIQIFELSGKPTGPSYLETSAETEEQALLVAEIESKANSLVFLKDGCGRVLKSRMFTDQDVGWVDERKGARS